MSDLGSLISAFLVAGSILAWGFRDRIEELLHSAKHVNQEKELNLLIKPLHIAFDKFKDWTPTHWDINMMILGAIDGGAKEMLKYKGLPLAFSIMFKFGPNGEYLKSLGADKVDSTIGILQQHGNLAQPQLKELIKQYFEIGQQGEKSEKKFWNDPNFINIYRITSQMDTLVKERYNELMWKS